MTLVLNDNSPLTHLPPPPTTHGMPAQVFKTEVGRLATASLQKHDGKYLNLDSPVYIPQLIPGVALDNWFPVSFLRSGMHASVHKLLMCANMCDCVHVEETEEKQ